MKKSFALLLLTLTFIVAQAQTTTSVIIPPTNPRWMARLALLCSWPGGKVKISEHYF